MADLKENVKATVISGLILAAVTGIAIVLYDLYKSRVVVDAQLVFVGATPATHLLEESSNTKKMMYPFQVKVTNTGNVPITITQVVTNHSILLNGKSYVQSSLYKRTQSSYLDKDILPNTSVIVNARAFIDDEIIENNAPVYIQAKLKIQGDKLPEKIASVNAFSVDSYGQPIPSVDPIIISSFK